MKTGASINRKNLELREAVKCLLVFFLITGSLISVTPFVKSSVLFFMILMLTGYLGWTFLEYFMHRFWMHSSFRALNHHSYQMHMHHHHHPTEIKITTKQRLLVFSICFLSTALAIYWNNYFTLIVGFLNGFLIYSIVHVVLHQRWGKYLFPQVQKFHIHHHGKYPDKGFSFSTPLWDRVFGTMPPKNAVISEKMEKFYFKD